MRRGPCVVAGALAIAATAWFGRDLSQMAAQPAVLGLAYLAFAIAVAIRFGAIPFHLWAARLTDVVPETLAAGADRAGARPSLALVALRLDRRSRSRPLAVDLGSRTVDRVPAWRSRRSSWPASRRPPVRTSSTSSATRSCGDAGVIIAGAGRARSGGLGAPVRLWVSAFVVARSAFAAWWPASGPASGLAGVADSLRLGASIARPRDRVPR